MVNPKWGWEINENGELCVPEKKINWKQIDEELATLSAKIETMKNDLNDFLDQLDVHFPEEIYKLLTIYIAKQGFIPDSVKDSVVKLFSALNENSWHECIARITDIYKEQKRFDEELRLVNLKIKVIALELAPTLCYANISKTPTESEAEFAFRHQVEARVEQLAVTARKNDVDLCKNLYENELNNYNALNRRNSFIEKHSPKRSEMRSSINS